MKMQRRYMISNDLGELEALEQQLEAAGISTPQIHVLSPKESAVAEHERLHEIQSIMKSDLVFSTTRAALLGFCAFVMILLVAYLAGWTETAAGWMPFVFLAIVLFGFVTWEGGLYGIQKPNHNFARFEQALKAGKHIFFVDLEPQQEAVLEKLLKDHPRLELAGSGSSAPAWIIAVQQKFGVIRHS